MTVAEDLPHNTNYITPSVVHPHATSNSQTKPGSPKTQHLDVTTTSLQAPHELSSWSLSSSSSSSNNNNNNNNNSKKKKQLPLTAAETRTNILPTFPLQCVRIPSSDGRSIGGQREESATAAPVETGPKISETNLVSEVTQLKSTGTHESHVHDSTDSDAQDLKEGELQKFKDFAYWRGWAEIENDPEIFTSLLQQWGIPSLQVCEILDMADLLLADPDDIAGLVFLSPYRAFEPPPVHNAIPISPDEQPWFANQISKFSCGTVALVNVVMNIQKTSLGTTLDDFAAATVGMTAKQKGILLDDHVQFRQTHNSFSTLLDRQIVDVMLKDEVQKHKALNAAQNRSKPGKKRKRSAFTTKKKKSPKADQDTHEDGNHFVAYIQAHGRVWKGDGLLPAPVCIGNVSSTKNWLHVAAADLVPQMEQAFSSNEHCSLMRVTRANSSHFDLSAAQSGQCKQEDWAPFITHMLRLHADKGDLPQLLSSVV